MNVPKTTPFQNPFSPLGVGGARRLRRAKVVASAMAAVFGLSMLVEPAFAQKKKAAAAKPAPKKPSPAPAPAQKKTSKATSKAIEAANKVNKPKGLIAAKMSGGKVEVLAGFASKFKSEPKDLGKLVPMDVIVDALKKDIKAGKVLPGDPILIEYDRWLEGLGKSKAEVLGRRSKAKDNVLKDADVAPGELTEAQRKEFDDKYKKLLVPDVKAYGLFLHDMVLVGRGIKDAKDAAGLMYQYGCRAISRVLPGYAKIVEIRLPTGVDTTGDWDQPFNIEKKAEKKGGGDAASKPAKPEPVVEVVEVCSVTHKQVEATLKKDLLAIASAIAPKDAKDRDIKVLTGEPKLSGKDAPPDIDAEKMDKYDPALKDLTFQHVTKRLLSFYRKKGFSRNFAQALESSSKTAGKLSKSVRAKTPKAAASEAQHHSDEKIIGKRNQREVLRRAVEMWTYGYEYESVAHLVIAKKNALKSAYSKAEGALADEFWSSCKEIAAICEQPVEALEVKACKRCALDALEHHCIEGKDDKGKCRPVKEDVPATKANDGIAKIMEKVAKQAKDALHARLGFKDPPRTLKEWFALQLGLEATRAVMFVPAKTSADDFVRRVSAWVIGKKFFAEEENQEKGFTRAGMRYLDSLPLTTWQRCMLWNPKKDAEKQCAKGEFGKLGTKDIATMPWDGAILAKEALKVGNIKSRLDDVRKQAGAGFMAMFMPKGAQAPAIVPTGANPKDLAVEQKKQMGNAADAAADVIGPIVGKLLAMLLQAAGMNETMKMLAQAAGMTPQQSADCEDMEYRHEVMKLKGNDDNKRTCLTRIFAKNFTNVLESIIIMLGNKLVDWGVDLVRNVLQPVKSALLSAAGSVPFAGGFLATLIDICWELLMNFAAKALLKGFVVAKLPEWLKVRELASQPFEEVMKNPIVQVVLGIILMLIDAAMVHGEKSWMEVGAETALAAIQKILENPPGGKQPEWFWLRALTFAKKKLRESTGIASGEAGGLPKQIEKLAKAMVEGFFLALQRRLDGDAQAAVEDAKNAILQTDFVALATKLASNPTDILKVLREQIVPQIGKLILPIVAAFAPMPGWAKQLLVRVGNTVSDLLAQKSPTLSDGWKRVVEALEPLGTALIEQVPIADPTLKSFLTTGYQALVSVIKDPTSLPQKLSQPGQILKAFVEMVKPVLVERANALLKDAGIPGDVAGFGDALTSLANGVGGAAQGALAQAAGVVKKVADALIAKLGEAASKALAYAPAQTLVAKACQMLSNLIANPSSLQQSLSNAASFGKALLGELANVLGSFAQDSIIALIPAGFGRNLAAAVIDGVKKVVADPDKLKKLVQDAQSGIGKFLKNVLTGAGGLISMLLAEVKSDALKKILEMGIDLAMSQIVK